MPSKSKWWRKAIAEGKCTLCGAKQPPEREGLHRCEPCQKEHYQYRKDYKAARKEAAAIREKLIRRLV